MIQKENSILILNKNEMLKFYYQFYSCIENKNKEVKISIGEKILDSRNTILFSFCNYKEILEQLKFKKGTLFYEYLLYCLEKTDISSDDHVFYNLVDIVKSMLRETDLNIEYDLEEDLEKLIFNTVTFNLNFKINEITNIFKCLLESFLERNQNKNYIIFYDSSLLSLELKKFDFCYSFDISEQKILRNIIYFV